LTSLPGVASSEEALPGEASAKKEKNYVIAPLFLSNPNVGTGLGGTGIYFYSPSSEEDTVSPPSSVTLMGWYTNTDSYMLGLFNQSYYKEDMVALPHRIRLILVFHPLDAKVTCEDMSLENMWLRI
jgi:hypothetical protein